MQVPIATRAKSQPPLYKFPSRKLTVAVSSLSIGGAEKIVLDWANRIDRKWSVHLIVLRNRPHEWPVPQHVKVTRLEDPRRLQALRDCGDPYRRRLAQLRLIGFELAESENPVVVCHLLGKEERDALAEGGAHVVNVLHNAKDGWPEEVGCLDGAHTIAVSEACERDLRSAGYRQPVTIIRHLPAKRKQTDASARAQYRAQWNIPEHATVIGMIGAVKPQKDYIKALEVLRALRRTRDAYLVILGGPLMQPAGREYWKRVVAAVRELGLRSRVAMPGFIPDAARCFGAFDCMLNTSRFEGLSIATLEALTEGVNVVASAVGGQGEVGCERLTLVPHDSHAEAWAAALERALTTTHPEPSWRNFPSFRLWTLAGLARPVKPSDKTLVVTANLNLGGAQRSLVNLTGELGKEVSVMVAGNSTAERFYQVVKSYTDVERSADNTDAFDNAEAIVSRVCSERYGVVCFWNLDAKVKLLVTKALSFTQVRIIDVSPGDNSFDEMSDIARFADLIAFPKERFYERLDKLVMKYQGSTPPSCNGKTAIIRNGVQVPNKRKSDYAIRGKPRIVVNGRIAPTKFLIEIADAVRLVRKSIPGAELHVYGEAEAHHAQYVQLFRLSNTDAIGKWIHLHGTEFELDWKLHEHDAFVVLGKDQGCPNALLEALARGLPCISNDNGGACEQIIDGVTGLLVPDRTPESLALALQRILQDRALARRLGEAGRAHVLEHFSMARMAGNYRALFAGGVPQASGAHAFGQAVRARGSFQPQQTKEHAHAV